MVGTAVNLHPRSAAQFGDPPPPSRHENIYAPGCRAAGAIPRTRRKSHAMTQRTRCVVCTHGARERALREALIPMSVHRDGIISATYEFHPALQNSLKL